jgi:hypothetical protein
MDTGLAYRSSCSTEDAQLEGDDRRRHAPNSPEGHPRATDALEVNVARRRKLLGTSVIAQAWQL